MVPRAIVNLTVVYQCPHTEEISEIWTSRCGLRARHRKSFCRLKKERASGAQAGAGGLWRPGRTVVRRKCTVGDDTLADILQTWEDVFNFSGGRPDGRVVIAPRFCVGQCGGACGSQKNSPNVLGGAAGKRQAQHQLDISLVQLLIAAKSELSLTGPFNAVGAHPVTNGGIMRECVTPSSSVESARSEFAVRLGAKKMTSDTFACTVSRAARHIRFWKRALNTSPPATPALENLRPVELSYRTHRDGRLNPVQMFQIIHDSFLLFVYLSNRNKANMRQVKSGRTKICLAWGEMGTNGE